MSVNHPKLSRLDPETIRRFLELFDQYVNDVEASSWQLADEKCNTKLTKLVEV